jgi:ABC transporter substrate binding protein
VRSLQRATGTVPIVFAGITDPVGGGLVAGLTRPGGNSTGFTNFEYGISTKWLELLKQIAPGVTREPIPTNARTELPKRGRKMISSSQQRLAARTFPASRSAPVCLTSGPSVRVPDKGLSFANEPRPRWGVPRGGVSGTLMVWAI